MQDNTKATMITDHW